MTKAIVVVLLVLMWLLVICEVYLMAIEPSPLILVLLVYCLVQATFSTWQVEHYWGIL